MVGISKKYRPFVLIGCVILGCCIPVSAASVLSLDNLLNNLPGLLAKEVVSPLVRTFGLVFNHRPMEPATPLGTQFGFDLGVEFHLVQIPNELFDELQGYGLDLPFIPDLPSIRELNFHKGISNSVDVGGAILSYQGYLIWGIDLKIVLSHPEEGPTWAIRLSRNSVHLPVGNLSILDRTIDVSLDAVTWTPMLLVSKKLEFADPYLGLGYQYVTGGLNVNITGDPLPGIDSIAADPGGGVLALIGLSLKPPNIGLRVTLEGAYSSAGTHSLGTKVGFSF